MITKEKIMWIEPRSGTCFNCGQPGHMSAQCPAQQPNAPKPEPKTLSDGDIIGRIQRIYQPESATELQGLVKTWRDNYLPGNEYPEAPRYAKGFVALCAARARERADRERERLKLQ